jgi:hypothetical protein
MISLPMQRPLPRYLRSPLRLISGLVLAWPSSAAHAGAAFYSSFSEWTSAADSFDTLDFNLGSIQFLGEQYAGVGVHFDSISALAGPSAGFFPLDGWGMGSASSPNPVSPVALDGGRFAFGLEYISDVRIQLFSGGTMLWDSGNIVASPLVDSAFAAVITDTPFDSLKVSGAFFTTLSADNFYVGHAVPGPGALAGAVLFGLGSRRRRR